MFTTPTIRYSHFALRTKRIESKIVKTPSTYSPGCAFSTTLHFYSHHFPTEPQIAFLLMAIRLHTLRSEEGWVVSRAVCSNISLLLVFRPLYNELTSNNYHFVDLRLHHHHHRVTTHPCFLLFCYFGPVESRCKEISGRVVHIIHEVTKR